MTSVSRVRERYVGEKEIIFCLNIPNDVLKDLRSWKVFASHKRRNWTSNWKLQQHIQFKFLYLLHH